jgi:hypothetical protein
MQMNLFIQMIWIHEYQQLHIISFYILYNNQQLQISRFKSHNMITQITINLPNNQVFIIEDINLI